MTLDRPLLIVDGDNLAHRAYHSSPKSIKSDAGDVINAIVGFFSMLLRIHQEESPRAVFVAWDTLGVDTYRSKLWPPYQSGREFEPDIVRQLGLLPELCREFRFGVGKGDGCEADDFMAAAALEETERGGTSLVLTTDKDAYQLASDSVTILAPKRGQRELERIGPREVVERLGVLPEQVPDFKALAGDPSDKIPGISGIGPKAAASLLLKHGTLERVVENWRAEDQELALRFREVVRMQPDVAVELPTAPPDWTKGAAALEFVGAKNLAERARALSL